MMSWLVDSSLRFSRVVAALAVGIIAVAIFQLRDGSLAAYPEFRQTTVEVQAEALGLSASEVEQLITVSLEQDLLNGVPWVEKITSKSMPGLASVELTFEEGTDLYQARQVVQERMTQAHALPGVGTAPQVIQARSALNRASMISLSSKEISPIEMSILARWQIKPRLLGVPGVANVSVWGQRDRQLQVQVDPQRLHGNGVTLARLIETTGNSMWVSPLSFVEASTPGTGGFVETPNQRLGVQHVSPITSSAQLGDVVIADGTAGPKRIGDVATVVEDHQPLIGDAAVDGEPTIMIVVDKFPEADTAQVSHDVAEAMASMAPGLGGITVKTDVYDPAGYVERAVNNLGLVGVIGLLLMALVIGLLLASWRVALISLVSVPLSLLAAVYVLHLRDTTFTAMTLVGLCAALALVVDDLITDVTRIRGRLRDSAANGSQLPRGAVVADAVLSGRRPLAYATVIALAAALPLLALTGVVGSFTRQAAISYGLAVLASLLVALTVTPTLALLLRGGPGTAEPPVQRLVGRGFDRVVAGSITRRARGLVAAGVLGLLSLAVIPQLGSGSSLPELRDRNLLVQLETMPGTGLAEMTRITGAITREVQALPGVGQVGTNIGRALTSDQVADVNTAEMWVTVSPDASQSDTETAVRGVVTGYPGVAARVSSYADERLAAADRPQNADLVVRVYGDEAGTLQRTAESVRQTMASVRGVVSPRVDQVPLQPTARIEVDLDKVKQYGLKPGDVRRETATLVSGLLVGNLYEEQKVFDVVVWGTPAARQSPAALASLMIDTPDGGQVRLGDIASVEIAPEAAVINHDAVRRYVDVLAAVPSRDRADVAADVTNRLQAMDMPLEYRAEVVGGTTGERGIGGTLLAWVVGVLIGVLLVFQAAVHSWRAAGLLMATTALAGAGSILVAPAVGGITSAGALAGFLGIVVLAARQGLVVVFETRDAVGTTTGSVTDAVLAAVRERATPVIVTALAVAALVLPAAVITADGLEFLHPAAITILAGLVTSTIVVLVVLPALYLPLATDVRPEPDDDRPEERPPDTIDLRETELTTSTTTQTREGS